MELIAYLGTSTGRMTTVADELLNDFEDSGSENGEPSKGAIFAGGETPTEDEAHRQLGPGSGFEVDEDGDVEVGGMDVDAPAHSKMEDPEDEEETKARVEKLELKGVHDVRSVAGLMKQLEPIVEVSPSGATAPMMKSDIYNMCPQPS